MADHGSPGQHQPPLLNCTHTLHSPEVGPECPGKEACRLPHVPAAVEPDTSMLTSNAQPQ